MMNMEFFMPTRLITGEHCVMENRRRLAAFGSRCLIVTGGSGARRSGALADLTAALEAEGVTYEIFDRITPNPAVSLCQAGGQAAAAFRAQFVVGVGGGSPLDAAKAVAVFAANPEMTEAEFYSADWPRPPLPIVLVGTTAGTGSEVTSVAVLTDGAGRKHSIHDDRLYAALALGDARYTMTLPQDVTLSTGIDAVAHCVESAFSKKADRLSRLFAAEGVRLAVPALNAAAGADAAPDAQTRAQLYAASILGGLAINRTGTVFPHNVGYYLTERWGIPHGFACAVFLPDLLDHVAQSAPALAEDFYRAAGVSADELRQLVRACLPPMNACATEAELRAALPRWQNNGSVKNTVGAVSQEQIFTALKQLLVDRA